MLLLGNVKDWDDSGRLVVGRIVGDDVIHDLVVRWSEVELCVFRVIWGLVVLQTSSSC